MLMLLMVMMLMSKRRSSVIELVIGNVIAVVNVAMLTMQMLPKHQTPSWNSGSES